MVEESDADRLWRDRESRRALERARLERERRLRENEPQPWPSGEPAGLVQGPAPPDAELPRVVIASGGPTARVRPTLADRPAGTRAPSREASGRPRAIGGSVVPGPVQEFLKTDPTEGFDIQALNGVPLAKVVDSAGSDPDLLGTIVTRVEALMTRVKHELDDPLSAGAFLREQALRWYRESPSDTEWNARSSARWAGLFADSRVSGGRLQPWLSVRLASVRQDATRAGSLRTKLKRSLLRGDRAVEVALSRSPAQQILAEVAQALLDDLASRARDGDAPLPLVRLSELAVRRQLPTINDALALLFSGPESGPFIVLHPNRYPDAPEVLIRPPVGGSTGAALAYALAPGRPVRRAPASEGGGSPSRGADGSTWLASHEGEASEELDAVTVWTSEEVSGAAWRRLLSEHHRARRRLDSPPKDCRSRPAYAALRALLLSDSEARKAFLAVRWRGRPTGLPLLVSLLQKGVLAPDVATDHEYLEAELGEMLHGDPQWHPTDGHWPLEGWTIRREGSHGEGFRFRAERPGKRGRRAAPSSKADEPVS